MITPFWPDHLLSLDEWIALPEDNSRHFELEEGVLVVGPKPPPQHQRLVFNLAKQIDDQLPPELELLPQVEVVVDAEWPPTVRVPDIIVVPSEVLRADTARCAAADVRQVVEVSCAGTRRIDSVRKKFEYAEAGIPSYWLVDADDPGSLTTYRLVDGRYEVESSRA